MGQLDIGARFLGVLGERTVDVLRVGPFQEVAGAFVDLDGLIEVGARRRIGMGLGEEIAHES
jgi:CRISPR/Cas system endoribonuclease Cas6 (RAMP superfamily)